MARRWHLPFPIHSDPGGERLLKQLDLWNDADRGGIAWPAILLCGPDGEELHRWRSRDFADRPPGDSDVLAALRALDLPPATLDPWVPEVDPVEDPGALRTETFGPYFRGIRFGVSGLANRLTDPDDRAEALRMTAMAASFLDAWKVRREAAES